MSLDFYIEKVQPTKVAEHNITHNLKDMFREAGIHDLLWRGDGKIAGEIIGELCAGLALMEADPERFRKHNDPGGWGTYPNALRFLRSVIASCASHPDGIVRCSR